MDIYKFIQSFIYISDVSKEISPESFYFMGDDDNDVEAAAASVEAFITKPCSLKMQNFIDEFASQNKIDETGHDQSVRNSNDIIDDEIVYKVPNKIINEAPFLRHKGTEFLLSMVLDRAKAQKIII
jgi:hypothetical protein